MADVRGFAGFLSPGILVRDPHLSRADKIDALAGWRSALARAGRVEKDEMPADRRRLIGEISLALALLARH
jgi:hypothetical protein